MSTKGVAKKFALPPSPPRSPYNIIPGPDGNLWFTENSYNAIARMTLSGELTEYTLPHPSSGPLALVAASDGNLWFTELGEHAIGRITPPAS
jgi:virginiamycin B lyase